MLIYCNSVPYVLRVELYININYTSINLIKKNKKNSAGEVDSEKTGIQRVAQLKLQAWLPRGQGFWVLTRGDSLLRPTFIN